MENFKLDLLCAIKYLSDVPRRALAALFRAERRVRENDVEIAPTLPGARERVAAFDFPLDAVKRGVHQREPVGFAHQLDAAKRFPNLELRFFGFQVEIIVRRRSDETVGRDHKAERAARRVVAAFADLRRR